MEGLNVESGPPTPIDDTPYIRFAIDQLTRDEDIRAVQRPSTSTSSDSYPVDRIVPDLGLGYMSNATRRQELALTRKHRSTPVPSEGGRLFNFNATRPLSGHSVPSVVPERQLLSAGPENFLPYPPPTHSSRYPNLTFIPTILRPASMITLSILCVLMIAALIFTTIYANYHHGLTEFSGGIHGGRYFLFAFLPQIFAACIFVYVQGVMAAITRIMPYTMMAMDDAKSRAGALFLNIFPRTMLWPRWEGPGVIIVSNTLFWLSTFTIPLQSCLFSVTQVDGVWRWTAVAGVAWTLVAVYILLVVASTISALFFYRRRTGLIWDARSLADIMALLPRSNCLGDYVGTDIMHHQALRDRLYLRSDRLGYWMTQHRNQGLFYCIGEEGTSTRRYTLDSGKLQEKKVDQSYDIENNAGEFNEDARFATITWYLRDTFVIFWVVAGFLALLALVIVSFLPSTAIRKGFPPLLNAAPNSQEFSPANFLYSFVPAFLGMLLYLWFQSLEMGLRKLQPWAELAQRRGATAENSILLEYTAELPIRCTLSAFDAGHYRVSILSLLSFAFILLPILAGGIFFALTTPTDGVRMLPNLPAFYICIILLILYLFGLMALVPNRFFMHLPHAADCLAEIISFVHSSRCLDDAAFRAPRSKADLITRLMAAQSDGSDARYAFGAFQGRHGKQCFGIEKLGRPGVQIHT